VGLFPLLDRESNDEEGKSSNAPTLFPVGTLCAVLRMLKIPDGTVRLLVHGISRISIESFVKNPPETVATIQRVNEIEVEDDEVEALKKETLDTLQKAIQLTNMSEDLAVAAMNIEDGGKLADLVATNLGLKIDQLQRVLSETNTKERLRLVYTMLSREVHVLEIGNNISEKVRESVDRNQRDFFLREQIKAMQGELGESDPHESEMGELRDRLAKKQMPDYARKVAERELGRLIALQPAAAEYGVIRTYLEWIIDLPWSECTDDHIDLLKAAKILDEDHYGLDKVKERILEFLAVIRLKGGNLKGPILCLVGPPGVGKTSLGKSIARATGRKFTRFSLGGMRDEAEIRGHRRTYIGAMPGRIVKALKDCGTVNPLIMLDEVDKLGSDFRGDPASALLEVLDPEQNDSFTDHYMDMPINLSKVMFITTANSLDTIPGPLRDRMEIIRIAGYMQSEKLEIAKRYLVPREIENTGLRKSDLRFTPPALRQIISDYTQEAGVRLLQKQIASIARKVARKIAEEESKQEADALKSAPKTTAKGPAKKKAVRRPSSITIKPDDLEKYLGMQKQFNERAERLSIPGVAIGLAWTSFGGEILFVEATRHPGKGRLQLTGQLGEVMKESASAALTFLRANRHILSASDDEFANFDFHVHVPAGATPKDGPSAGVAILIALSSLVTGRLVKDYTAMTGEISLRGNVLAVGGIKEKCLAAHRSGVKEILLPRRNERDLEEIPEAIRKTVKFHFLDRVESALEHALRPVPVARLATPPTHGGKSPGTKVLRPIATPAPRG
jgi:ATP-dependent Lon protease